MRSKVIAWLIVALLVYYAVSAPTDAAATGKSVLSGAKSAGDAFITLFKALAK
ncbi:hypothetical protein [Dactylosporangium sp. NPDC049140]|uniref:hypothetical protein n=1 Tax=Dactylosporangium sp. NPDC049140 TaxID=3155647 RepID=UPI0033FFE6D5